MAIKDKLDKVDRKVSLIQKNQNPNSCLSSTTRSGIKYAIVWAAYVLIGSWVFLVLEETSVTVKVEHQKWKRLKELLNAGDVIAEVHELRRELLLLCPFHWFNSTFDELLLRKNSTERSGNLSDAAMKKFKPLYVNRWIEQTATACEGRLSFPEEVIKYPEWSFADAVYYTMTLVTTIGFGHISPTTDVGKLFCVTYALAGVPLTCIFIAKNSDMLSNRMLQLYLTAKKRYRRKPTTLLYGVTWLFLLFGCFLFMFVPSIAFAALEEWSYIDAFYFTFITLSTIGFGDYIAGYNNPVEYPETYKVLIVVWIMAALGYWILLLNFLQKAIKSNAKTLKKTFAATNITKQAEFLRHLIAKVKQEESNAVMGKDIDDRLHMMAVFIESMANTSRTNRLGSERSDSIRSIRHTASRTSMSIEPRSVPVDEHTIQIEAEEEEMEEEVPAIPIESSPEISFSDLMKVNVALKTESLPGLETLVKKSGSVTDFFSTTDNKETDSIHQSQTVIHEVTLPLRDVLGIVLLVASMEECHNGSCDGDEDTPSEDSNPCSVPVVDPKQSVPLLRSVFLQHIEGYKPPQRIALTQEDKDSIKTAYFETALNHYLEECSNAADNTPNQDVIKRSKSLIA